LPESPPGPSVAAATFCSLAMLYPELRWRFALGFHSRKLSELIRRTSGASTRLLGRK
jgi:hypothetical protein